MEYEMITEEDFKKVFSLNSKCVVPLETLCNFSQMIKIHCLLGDYLKSLDPITLTLEEGYLPKSVESFLSGEMSWFRTISNSGSSDSLTVSTKVGSILYCFGNSPDFVQDAIDDFYHEWRMKIDKEFDLLRVVFGIEFILKYRKYWSWQSLLDLHGSEVALNLFYEDSGELNYIPTFVCRNVLGDLFEGRGFNIPFNKLWKHFKSIGVESVLKDIENYNTPKEDFVISGGLDTNIAKAKFENWTNKRKKL